MKIRINLLIFSLLIVSCVCSQTNLVKIEGQGKLSYFPDSEGFVLPNFSHAGYRGGGVDLPIVPTVKEISPVVGDNTAHIQAAIEEVGKRTPDVNGFRGALLLKAGKYEVVGTLNVKYSGVVLRGVGNGTNAANSTIIYAKGNVPHQRDVIVLGATSQNRWFTDVTERQNITDNVVPVGAYSFTISNASNYKVGDLIGIFHPCSSTWLSAINYGGVPAPAAGEADERWTVGKYPILYHRYITKKEGNTITMDAPVFYSLKKSLAQCYVYKFNSSSILKEIGIENLRVDIESLGGEDENHAWQAIGFRSLENGWAKNVVTKGFGQSGFITDCTTRTTIEDCQAIDPVSIITGERRYNFNTYVHSQLILFKNCYASNGRHHYVSNGTSTVSGVVFLNCISDATNSVAEGHRHWTQGMLFDGYKEKNQKRTFTLGLYNRVDMGTGHGWAAVQSVLWNCDLGSTGVIGLQKPPTSQNYAIGCTAASITGVPISGSNFPVGYVELQNKTVTAIPSLYLAQLNDRLNNPSGIKQANTDKPYTIDFTERKVMKLHFTNGFSHKKVSIYTTQGEKYISQKVENEWIEINLPHEGLYILCLELDAKLYSEKVIII